MCDDVFVVCLQGNFFQNLGSIVMFAVFGTAISAVIVGGGLYVLGMVSHQLLCSFIRMYICNCVCMFMIMYTYVRTYVCVYIRTYIRT